MSIQYSITDGHAPVDLGKSTNWLSRLTIPIPKDYLEMANGRKTMRIGINNLTDEIYLGILPRNGSGQLELIYRACVNDANGSPDLSRKAREIASSEEAIAEILGMYVKQKHMIVDMVNLKKPKKPYDIPLALNYQGGEGC